LSDEQKRTHRKSLNNIIKKRFLVCFMIIVQIVMLVVAVSVDALGAGLIYGMSRIRMPLYSVGIVSAVSAMMLGLAMETGRVLSSFWPECFGSQIGFVILMVLGLVQLLKGTDEQDIQEADRDGDKALAAGEAAFLGLALSLDSAAAGVGMGLASGQMLLAVPAAFLINLCLMCLGSRVGKLLTGKVHTDLTRMGGILLILLAVSRLFF